MSALAEAAEQYLRLRRSLGHELADAHRLLPRFVTYLDSIGATTVTVAAAMDWAQQPVVGPDSTVRSRRLTVARGFARHMAGLEPDTEIPPLGLIPSPARWRPPYIYSDDDIAALIARARAIRFPLAAATYETLIGLLAVTGLRVGEALRLDRRDVDTTTGVLMIHESKFGKSRQVPIHGSTLTALNHYARVRDRLRPRPQTPSFFVSMRGTRTIYPVVQQTFRRLCGAARVGADAPNRPRIHDLRHTFSVSVLMNWYQTGEDVEAMLPMLSTYLGHRDPRSTYWYLSAAPELLALAAGRLEVSREVISR